MSKLKKDIGLDEEPTLQNFFKFLKKHYGREANFGEVLFKKYHTSEGWVESDPVLFCRLSEKYYSEIHQVENPVKDGEAGLKRFIAINWVWKHNNGTSTRELIEKTIKEDKEFNALFEEAWNDIIEKGDFTKYNELGKSEYI